MVVLLQFTQEPGKGSGQETGSRGAGSPVHVVSCILFFFFPTLSIKVRRPRYPGLVKLFAVFVFGFSPFFFFVVANYALSRPGGNNTGQRCTCSLLCSTDSSDQTHAGSLYLDVSFRDSQVAGQDQNQDLDRPHRHRKKYILPYLGGQRTKQKRIQQNTRA
ncbi:hypothetical protein LX36DRAFT_356275 [Colletotrichum falcatum]|nr:hypothetical protein LX36DRAFT_356275 [Colletotrichum falcatum]